MSAPSDLSARVLSAAAAAAAQPMTVGTFPTVMGFSIRITFRIYTVKLLIEAGSLI